jgi:hypothetical protein
MAEGTKATDDEKRKRMRSPAYPYINLETAIKRAVQFYEKEVRNAAPVKVAVKHWGYEEKSSGGLQTAAALISFGLMRDDGTGDKRKLRLTDNALRIILDSREESEDRADAIRTAALTPKIHQQLWRKWGNNIPSTENFRHTLILEWEPPFNPAGVDGFIREYKDTIAFAKPDSSVIVPLANDDNSPEIVEEGAPHMQRQMTDQDATLIPTTGRFPPTLASSQPVGSSIPVTEKCVMSISASGEVTQKGIGQLIAYLNLIKGSFPKGED